MARTRPGRAKAVGMRPKPFSDSMKRKISLPNVNFKDIEYSCLLKKVNPNDSGIQLNEDRDELYTGDNNVLIEPNKFAE